MFRQRPVPLHDDGLGRTGLATDAELGIELGISIWIAGDHDEHAGGVLMRGIAHRGKDLLEIVAFLCLNDEGEHPARGAGVMLLGIDKLLGNFTGGGIRQWDNH